MRIIARLSFLVFVPLIVGLALVVSGYSIGAWILAIGVPAVMIVLVIAGLIMLMKGKLFDKRSENSQATVEQSEKEREQSALNEINNSDFYKNQFKLAEYEAAHISEGTKNASKKGMAIVFTIIALLLADVILAVVFTVKQIWAGAIVCVAIFGATIVISLITAVIREKVSMNGDIGKAKKIVEGKVKTCVLSSMQTFERTRNPAVKISGVVYRVVVIADGAEYEAFSKQFYETDETVTVAVMGKKSAKIVVKNDVENQDDIKTTEN